MAAMVATIATKNDPSSWRAELPVAVVTTAPFPRPTGRAETAGCLPDWPEGIHVDGGGPDEAVEELPLSLLEQRWRQLPPLGERQRARVGGKHLHADVIGARGVVRADPIPEGVDVAPRHDGVRQAVAAAVADV